MDEFKARIVTPVKDKELEGYHFAKGAVRYVALVWAILFVTYQAYLAFDRAMIRNFPEMMTIDCTDNLRTGERSNLRVIHIPSAGMPYVETRSGELYGLTRDCEIVELPKWPHLTLQNQ